MVTLSSVDSVMKSAYLEAVCEQLNMRTNPFYAAIQKGSEEICGKEAMVPCRYGINGGIGAGTETGDLPSAGGNNYVRLACELRNIYGTVEISDKALRAGSRSAGALVNVLNEEMEGLLESAKFNFARMLWQDGSGKLATVGKDATTTVFPVDDTRNLAEGMLVDVMNGSAVVASGLKIKGINRVDKTVTVEKAVATAPSENYFLTVQQSYNREIFGLPYIFSSTQSKFYNHLRSTIGYLLPQTATAGKALSTALMQTMLDDIEVASGNEINMILTGYDVRRKYLSYLETSRSNIDYMNLDGGFKSLAYNGIPVVADRFCPDTSMYFINTDDFKLVQLADWQWIEGENGSVLTQLGKTPSYMGTLVKYANLMCRRPMGQALLTFVS